MRVPYIPNYERIARKIASGPNFGIHGTKYSNLEGILRSDKSILGHYLAADNKIKRELDPKQFYEQLCASIDVALGFSAKISYDNKTITSNSLPLIILGVEKKGLPKGSGIFREDERSCGYNSRLEDDKGSSLITFPVGDIFFKNSVDIIPLIIDPQEIEEINDEFKRYLDRLRKKGPIIREDIVANQFFMTECIQRYVSKIHTEVYLKALLED